MKKICIILIILLLSVVPKSFADELGLDEYSSGFDDAWNGQKQITDEDFEKTVKQLQDKKNAKQIKKKKKQGHSLFEDDDLDKNPMSEVADETILLSLPVNLLTENETEIPTGHYNVIGKKVKGKVYLEFRQAHLTIANIEATETNNDFEQTAINFVKVLPYNENYIKLIYGSMDFNAYTLMPIKNGIAGQ